MFLCDQVIKFSNSGNVSLCFFYAAKLLDTKCFRPHKSLDIKIFRHMKCPNINVGNFQSYFIYTVRMTFQHLVNVFLLTGCIIFQNVVEKIWNVLKIPFFENLDIHL